MTRTLCCYGRRIPCARKRAGSAVSTILLLTLSIAAMACGGGPGPQDEPEGLELVMGSALDRQGYLLVPREGGAAGLRSPLDPSEQVWQGRRSLPPSRIALPVGRGVVLQTPDGEVFRFDPSSEALQPLGRMPADAATFTSDIGVALVGDGIALAVTQDQRVVARPDGQVWWAEPAADGRVVLIAGEADSKRLEVWESGTAEENQEPLASEPIPAAARAHTVARGTRLLVTDPAESMLTEHALPTLDETARFELGFSPAAVSASASAHQLYVSGVDREEIAIIDRFGADGIVSRPGPAGVESVRPSALGDILLLRTGDEVYRSAPDEPPAPLAIDWRPDLPLVLADGRVLAIRDGQMQMVWPDGQVDPLDAPADVWWIPVDWAPLRRPTAPATPASDPTSDASATEATTAPQPADAPPGEGFHVVAGSSRQARAIETLAARLRDAGFEARVAAHDAADGVRWYRVLIGPFSDRAAAEAAQARLADREEIDGWVLAPGSEGGP